MKIKDVMTAVVPTLDPDASLEEAAELMSASDADCLPIVENGRVVGLLTDRDIVVRALAKRLSPEETAVGDIMSYELVACGEDEEAERAEALMAERRVRRVLVLDESGALRGLVSVGNVPAAGGSGADVAAQVLEEVSRPLAHAHH